MILPKKYKLLLHIGLHKTATSSFQDNVCVQLHKEGKINFLGVSRKIDKIHHCMFAEDFASWRRPCSPDEITRMRGALEKKLTQDALNVISEENICHPFYDNEIILANLNQILGNCEVKVLISIREQVAWVQSLYIELCQWTMAFLKENNLHSLDRFVNRLLNEPDTPIFSNFFYEKYLDSVNRHFDDMTLLLFGDLMHDKDRYFNSLAALFGQDAVFIKNLFEKAIKNTKKTKGDQKLSSIGMDTYLSLLMNYVFPSILKKYLQEFSPVKRTYGALKSFLKNIRFHHAHTPLDKETAKNLHERLAIKDVDSFSKRYGLDKQALIKYGYTK